MAQSSHNDEHKEMSEYRALQEQLAGVGPGQAPPEIVVDSSQEPDAGSSLCGSSVLSWLTTCLSFPTLCCSCVCINERQEGVVLEFGRYVGLLKKPGCHCVNPAHSTVKTIGTAVNSRSLKDVNVVDARGNPVIMGGIVMYRVRNSRKAALDVEAYHSFLVTNALGIMKQVASLYPYQPSYTGEHSLMTEGAEISDRLRYLLQTQVAQAGIQVESFRITDLGYAPEIASAMLVRQKAEATLQARRQIVEGAVQITHSVIESLQAKGIAMDAAQQAKIANDLLIVMLGESNATPVLNVSGGSGGS